VFLFYLRLLIRSELEYISVILNNFVLTDSSKLGSVQRKFTNLCSIVFQSNISHNYDLILNLFSFRTFHSKVQNPDLYFLLMFLRAK
jgi:hypothetical protein